VVDFDRNRLEPAGALATNTLGVLEGDAAARFQGEKYEHEWCSARHFRAEATAGYSLGLTYDERPAERDNQIVVVTAIMKPCKETRADPETIHRVYRLQA
jgi:hypothetical protein